MASGPRPGTLDWVRSTRGVLTPAQRLALLPQVAAAHGKFLRGRLRMVRGVRPERTAHIGPADLVPPRSSWIAAAEQEAGVLPAAMWLHSLRAWQFARALADLDGASPDPELLYVAAVLHDVGLAPPTEGTCFTLAGAEAALRSAMQAHEADTRAETVADAITLHVHPGLRAERDGDVATYLQAGTLLDVVGDRVWDLDPSGLQLVLAHWPRTGFPAALGRAWRHECSIVPGGRARFLARTAALVPAAHLAPLPR